MVNVLSQEEIDELLNALNSGEDSQLVPEREEASDNVRQYDFRTANKFTKDQIRTLQFAFTNFAHLLSNHLSVRLRVSCEVEMISLEEQLFSEFYNALPAPVVLAIMTLAPFEGNILMELSPEVSYGIVNSLLGGSGKVISGNKNFTEIEMVIIERFSRQFAPLLVDAWSKVLKVEAAISRIETTPQFAQIVAMNETMAIITLEVRIGETNGLLTFCIPHMAVDSVAQQLNSRLLYASTPKKSTPNSTEALKSILASSDISVRVVFNETTASVNDILSLQEGDVIQLNQNVQEPLLVKLEHLPKFHGFIGTSGSHYAVQIVDIIKEGESHE